MNEYFLTIPFQETASLTQGYFIAEALITAWQQHRTKPIDQLNYIRDRFEAEGIDLEHPDLNPRSEDIYKFCLDRHPEQDLK